MPNSVNAATPGARAAKELLLRLQRLVREAAANGQDPDIVQILALAEEADADSRTRRGLRLAICEYIVSALQGNVIDISFWRPLEDLDPHHRPVNHAVKRF
jgi:hypothetical protein